MKRQLLYALIVIGIGLLLLEGAARIAELWLSESHEPAVESPGWQAKFFGSLFDWHESDPELLWRFRAGLDNPLIRTNSDHLLGPEIPAPKGSHSYRLLLLGDSSPVGLGLAARRQAFGEQTRYLLDKKIGATRRVELINAAVSGYTSEQIVRFLENRGWDYDPDLVILYCGNNDASISGLFSDSEILQAQKLTSLRTTLSHLALYRVLRSFLSGLAVSDNGRVDELKIRVSPDRFAQNLDDIVEQCRRHDCPLIILKPPVPYLWPAGLQFKPFIHLTGGDGRLLLPEAMADLLGRNIAYCIDDKRFESLYGRGDVFTRDVYRTGFVDSLDPVEAIDRYLDLIPTDPQNPIYYNNLGVACWRDRQYDRADAALKKARELFDLHYRTDRSPARLSALSPFYFNIGVNLLALESHDSAFEYDTSGTGFAYLDSALQADHFSLRIKKAYWDKIDRLADKPGVVIVDLPSVFARHGGERLFVDHCHPTVEGHRLIAREIARVVAEKIRPR